MNLYVKMVHREGNLSLDVQLAVLNIYYLGLFTGETPVDPPSPAESLLSKASCGGLFEYLIFKKAFNAKYCSRLIAL